MHLKFTWPLMADFSLRENFFCGGWHPREPLTLEWTALPTMIRPAVIRSANWFLLSNTSPLHPHRPGLIHADQAASGNRLTALAFRGYLLAPPIHSYSPSSEILRYWSAAALPEHNGVFSAACLSDAGQTLELITDAFGIAPLYYRALGEVILFATNPRYLTLSADEADYLAWRCLIQTEFIAADRTLATLIKRVPAGHTLRFQQQTLTRRRWFDYAALPYGMQKIDAPAVAAVEEAFQTALSRCLDLKGADTFLPLTSGYDSRRILAGLMDRKTPFQAATVRDLDKGDRDLDAHFASLMAQDFGFPHYVIPRQNALEYAHDDYQRRLLLDAESPFHTWAVSLMRNLPKSPTLFFDGLGGDVIGNAQFIIAGPLAPGVYTTPAADQILFAQYTITDDYDTILHPERWPAAIEVRREVFADIGQIPPTMSRVTIAKMLLRTRRTIAPWAQHMLPAGHVVVCPYLDLDYIRLTLAYHPLEKFYAPFQKACLERYWPRYFAYPGSKAIPPEMPPGSPALRNARELACFWQIQKELFANEGIARVKALLTRKAKARFWLALQNDRLALKSMWAFRRLMKLVARDIGKISCWEIVPQK